MKNIRIYMKFDSKNDKFWYHKYSQMKSEEEEEEVFNC